MIDPVACTNGTWTYDPANVAGEIVYVACNVRVGTSATVSATIVAEGRIDIGGATEAFAPPPGQPALVSLTTTGRGPENWGNTRGAWPGPGRIVDLPDNDHWRS